MASSQETLSQTSQSAEASAYDRKKYQSPPPPLENMTPPPTSQAPQLVHAPARTPSPQSHLSSPPPTVKPGAVRSPLENVASMYGTEQVDNATMDELKSMLAEVDASYREARAAAAHRSLQYNLLSMEKSEAMKRMEVELDMAQKEVLVLRNSQAGRPTGSLATPIMSNQASPSNQQVAVMRNQYDLLELENVNLRQRYQELSSIMVEREQALGEQNERLRERIRENRKHINMLHRSGSTYEGSPFSAYTTPRTHHTRLEQMDATPRDGNDKPFAALLLADQVLSQEAATAPSTPQPRRGQLSRHRGTYSLSSLPSTPAQARTAPPAAHFQQPFYNESLRTPLPPGSAPYKQRRQESRDSTISASDVADDRSDAGYSSVEEDVQESQASQEATNMLRKNSLRQSFGSSPSSHSAAAKSSGLLQSKLYGAVRKPGSEASKRKASSALPSVDRGPKKGRSENIGLGIGGFVSPSK